MSLDTTYRPQNWQQRHPTCTTKRPPVSNSVNISINLDSAKFEKEDSFSDCKEDRTKRADSSYAYDSAVPSRVHA
jgi:hypothetical protein